VAHSLSFLGRFQYQWPYTACVVLVRGGYVVQCPCWLGTCSFTWPARLRYKTAVLCSVLLSFPLSVVVTAFSTWLRGCCVVHCLRDYGTCSGTYVACAALVRDYCEVRCLYDFDRLQCPPYAACTASIQGCYVGHCPDDFDQFAVIFHCLHGCGTWLSRGTLSPGLRHMQRYIACSALLQIQDYCTVHCLNDFDHVQ
jgi:hypothetical protein